ncbi:hypothetical protein [Streptomyces sp. WAC01280]|uniref:hypothetical protein n=1 Tax=Streptomyces sp. WAC01280 TaxID=2487424 RepID=UPI0021AFD8D9|nr:hypothetical protein [Streptomyces sp. WAC01280]
MEALVREHVTSVDDLFTREHTPLIQVACWYVGEVHNRTRGTRWRSSFPTLLREGPKAGQGSMRSEPDDYA